MFRRVRGILFLVYGQQARAVFKELVLRVEGKHPELAGLHFGVVFSDESEASGEGEAGDAFFNSPERVFPIKVVESRRLDDLAEIPVEAKNHLGKAQAASKLEDEWVPPRSQDRPVVVSLIDNSGGECPDWVRILQKIRSQWSPEFDTGLYSSFSLLLSPNLQKDSQDTKTSPVFQNTAEAFSQLVRGSRDPAATGTWMPPLLVAERWLENNNAVEPGNECYINLVDLIYGLIAITLSDSSNLAKDQDDRMNCWTAGVLKIGLPIDKLLAEHRFDWAEKYSSKLLGKAATNTVQVQEDAAKWLRQSHLGKFDEKLAKDLLGKHRLKLPEGLKEPLSRSDDIEELFQLLKAFVEDHIQLIPGAVEKQRTELLDNFEKNLAGIDVKTDSNGPSVSAWLDAGRFHGEVVRILKMIRGQRGGGLAGHGEAVEDLRSKKWIKVFELERYGPKVRSDRLLRYQGLMEGLDELPRLPEGPEGPETLASIRRRIRELSNPPVTSKAAAILERAALKNLQAKHKKLTEKEEDLTSKNAQLAAAKGPLQEERKGEILELRQGIKQLRKETSELKKKWGFLNGEEGVEGWNGWSQWKRLPSEKKFLVVNYDDERKAHDELNKCRRTIQEREEDLTEGVRVDSAGGDTLHRASREEDLRELKQQLVPLESNWGSARKNLEDWQGELDCPREHDARVKWNQDSLENQLYVSAACAIQDEVRIKREKAVLRGLKQRLRDHTIKSLWQGGLILSVLALVLYLVLANVFPGSRAEIRSAAGQVTIPQGKGRLAFKVDGRSYDVTIPSGPHRMKDLADRLNAILPGTVCEESGGRLVIVSSVVGGDSSVEVLGGEGATALGLRGRASGSGVFSTKEFRWAVGLLLLVALVLFIRWYLVYSKLDKRIRALEKKIEGLVAKLKDWCTETVWLFQEAADNRVRLEAQVGGIKSIDRSMKIVERIQERFNSFGEEILASLEAAEKRAGVEEDFPKRRDMYSVINRAQLETDLITAEDKAFDRKSYASFEAKWSRSRMWDNFYSKKALNEWSQALDKAADDSYKVVRKFDLEDFLLKCPEILKKGGSDQRWIADNDSPMAGLIGIDKKGDITRRYVCCDVGKGNALMGRLGEISPWYLDKKQYTAISGKDENKKPLADKSEADLLALRCNVKGRRITCIQNGIEGLLNLPWKEGRDSLSRIGKDIDLFFCIENFEILKQRPEGQTRWKKILGNLPKLICSDSWSPKSGEFKYGGFDLGCSITEILCRLAGVGLTDDEIKQLEALKEKDCAAGVDDGFVVAHKAVDELFDQDFKGVAKDIWECWQRAKEKALDSLDPGSRFPEAPESPEPDSEPKAPEAPEADSEPPDTEDSEPDIEPESEPDQEPDSEADNDTGDDPDPPDEDGDDPAPPDGDSE